MIIFKNFPKKTDNQIIQILTSIKGIGSWTAEMFLIFTMQRIDVFSSKDIGLLNALKIVFDLDSRPSFLDAELLSKKMDALQNHCITISVENY